MSSFTNFFQKELNEILKSTVPAEELAAVHQKVRRDTLQKLKQIIGEKAALEVGQHANMFTGDWTRQYPVIDSFSRSSGGAHSVSVQHIAGQFRVLALFD